MNIIYAEDGKLHKVKDLRSGKVTVYNYDSHDRLELVTEYSSEDMYNDFALSTRYGEKNEITHFNFVLSYTASGESRDKNTYYFYEYDSEERLERETLDFGDGISASISYSYDIFDRAYKTKVSYESSLEIETE